MKKRISVLLAIILLLNCWIPAMVSNAATSVTPRLGTYSGAQDSKNRYVINITFPEVSALSQLGDVSGKVLINGEEKDILWSGWETDHYSLCVPYSACSRIGFSSDAEMKEVIYITVPEGTTIGDYTTNKAFHVKVTGNGMSEGSACKIEEVSSVPTDYYFASWNYNANAIFPRFNKCGVAENGWTGVNQTIYIDETATTVKWEGNQSYYYFTLNYSALGATSLSDVGEHTIRIPKGTSVGTMTLQEDHYIKTVKVGSSYVFTEGTAPNNAYVSSGGYQDNTGKQRYLIYIKPTEAMELEQVPDVSGTVKINGVEQTVTWGGWNKADGSGPDSYYLAIKYSQTKVSNATKNADVSTVTYVTIPAGTTVGNFTFNNDMHIKITGGGITTEDYKIEEVDSLPGGYYYGLWSYNASNIYPYFYSFTGEQITWAANQQTIYIDDSAYTVRWEGNGTYFYFPLPYSALGGTDRTNIGGHIIRIPSGTNIDQMLTTEDIYLKTVEKNGTCILVQISEADLKEETHTEVTLSNDTINGAEDLTRICLNATADPLEAGVYGSEVFTWAEETHGGIYRNGELLTTAKLQKPWSNYYYIDLSDVTDLKSGDIITLDGEALVDGCTYVKYAPISFIRNKNGSFSQYDANAEAIEAKTMNLNPVYVNLDKQPSYTIPNTPLAKNCGVTVKVNGNETTDVTLNQAGVYQVERTVENIELAKIVSTVGNITYNQTVCVFRTGDANLDGDVSAADIVRTKKNIQTAESVVGGASDLDYDRACTAEDANLLRALLAGKKVAADILANDQSVVIGAISDMHYQKNGRDAQSRINTRKALNYYKSQNVDVLIFNGDVTDLGNEVEYQKLVEDIIAVYPDESTRPLMIFTGDNHEWYDAWTVNGHTPTATFAETQERFISQLATLRNGNTGTNTHETVGGYHFIGVTSDGMDGGSSTYSDATISWVQTQLEAAASADDTGKKPIFLAIHQAPKNTVIFSDGADHYNSDAMDALLKQYPQLVVITSHTHAPLQDERSIHQGDFTTLNTASTYYAGGMSSYDNIEKNSLMTEKYQFGQCLLIHAEGNQVDVERVDVYNDEIIKNNWTFETSNNASDYTKYTSARATTNQAPTLDTNTVNVTMSEDKTTATVTLQAATDADDLYVDHYLVKVYKDETLTATYKNNSFYFLGLDRMASKPTFMIKDLDPSSVYRFEVQAVDAWGTTSENVNVANSPFSLVVDTMAVYGTPY